MKPPVILTRPRGVRPDMAFVAADYFVLIPHDLPEGVPAFAQSCVRQDKVRELLGAGFDIAHPSFFPVKEVPSGPPAS